jgi:tetrahydromethanopterin S-methyltransferase subunit A
MTLSKEQFTQFVENYVSHIVDGMDVDTLETMVFDLLCREYETYTEEQIVGEIEELYGEEVAADLVESASAV